MHSINFYGRAKKEANQIKRLNYAKKYVDEPPVFWDQIIFSDELTFMVEMDVHMCGENRTLFIQIKM